MYSPGVSNKMHRMSKVNIEYILSITDIFSEDDMAILSDVGKYEDLYNEDFDYFDKKIIIVEDQ
jgi:hypothetical protein